MGFPGSSAGKESACNAGDHGSIPRLGSSPGKRIGYPLQYSWASLVAQLVKNLLAMQETWVQSLGWEDPLEKGKATHSSILGWRIPWTKEPSGLHSPWHRRVGHDWVTLTLTFIPEWPSGFPFFLQFKPVFCNKELIIWATVSSRSCFYWLYGASPSLAAKNIIKTAIGIILLENSWVVCKSFDKTQSERMTLRLEESTYNTYPYPNKRLTSSSLKAKWEKDNQQKS